jgi:hypothetical protein
LTGDLQFDPIQHAFTWKGQPVPSVTQVLRDMGLASSWFKDDPIYRERGSAVHTASAYIDDGTFDESSTHPDLLGYTKGYERFLADTRFKAQASEVAVYSPALKVAGITDKYGVSNDRTWLLDLKSGKSAPKGVELQLGMYRLLLGNGITLKGEQVALKFDAVKCLHLPGDNSYSLIDCSDNRWLNHAQSAAALWALRKGWGLLNGKERNG